MSDEFPEWVKDAGQDYICIKTDQGPVNVTIQDVVRYLKTDWGMSGVRSFAGIIGDWRQIQEIVDFCLMWFKEVNIEDLESEIAKVLPT